MIKIKKVGGIQVNRLERRQIDFLITRNNKKKEQEDF